MANEHRLYAMTLKRPLLGMCCELSDGSVVIWRAGEERPGEQAVPIHQRERPHAGEGGLAKRAVVLKRFIALVGIAAPEICETADFSAARVLAQKLAWENF
jgi:hypothetical protein